MYLGFDQPRDMGGYVQGGNTAVPIFSQFVVASEGHWRATLYRSGRRTHGPHRPAHWQAGCSTAGRATTPRPIIWEAFKPDTEPRRTQRQDEIDAMRELILAQLRRRERGPVQSGADSGGGGTGGTSRLISPRTKAEFTNPTPFVPARAALGARLISIGENPMRAEGQAYIDRIEAALALVRRRSTGIGRKRLDELNAKVEDPTLWDDPKAAQEVMRERRRLEEAIGHAQASRTNLRIRSDRSNGGNGGRQSLVDEGVEASRSSPNSAERDKVAALLAGEADPNNSYVEVNSGAGARKATTGPRCSTGCTPAGPKSAASRSIRWIIRPASKPASRQPPC